MAEINTIEIILIINIATALLLPLLASVIGYSSEIEY